MPLTFLKIWTKTFWIGWLIRCKIICTRHLECSNRAKQRGQGFLWLVDRFTDENAFIWKTDNLGIRQARYQTLENQLFASNFILIFFTLSSPSMGKHKKAPNTKLTKTLPRQACDIHSKRTFKPDLFFCLLSKSQFVLIRWPNLLKSEMEKLNKNWANPEFMCWTPPLAERRQAEDAACNRFSLWSRLRDEKAHEIISIHHFAAWKT